jgi:hypothetical protein
MKASLRRTLFDGGLRLFRLLHGLGNVALPEHELALVLRLVPCRPDLREGSLVRTATASRFLRVAALAWINWVWRALLAACRALSASEASALFRARPRP